MVIGISEHSLLLGSLTVYLVPLVAMIGFGILGEYLGGLVAASTANSSELMSILFVFLGLIFSFIWLKGITKKKINKDKFQPVLLRLSGDFNFV